MLSKGIDLSSGMVFLDGAAPVLTAKFNKSSHELQTAYLQLKADAASGVLVKSQAAATATVPRYNLAPLSRYQTSSERLADTDDDITPATKKRGADLGTDSANEPEEDDKTRDWSKATPKPVGTTKALTESCLTCIQYKKPCKGTSINAEGKCENCQGHGPKKGTKRKCYWADPAANVKTYLQAKAKDPNRRDIKENTRAYRALRGQSQTPSTNAMSPASTTTTMSNNNMLPFTNHFPIINDQTSVTTSQLPTPSDLPSAIHTPGTDTTDAYSSTFMSRTNDDDDNLHQHFDQDEFTEALRSIIANSQVVNNGQSNTEATNINNSHGTDETGDEM